MYQFLCVVYIYLVNKQFDIYEIHTSGIYISWRNITINILRSV